MLNLKIVLFSLAVASTAYAMPVTYNFTGTVDQVGTRELTGLVVGQHIPIAITVDSLAMGSVGFYSGPRFDPSISSIVYLVESAGFNGPETATYAIQSITIVPGNQIEIFTGSPQTSSGFNLLLSGAVSGALATTAIPSALNPNDFTVGTFSVTEAFNPQDYGFSGTIDGIRVPEPASLALLASDLFGLGIILGRKHCLET